LADLQWGGFIGVGKKRPTCKKAKDGCKHDPQSHTFFDDFHIQYLSGGSMVNSTQVLSRPFMFLMK
jgi:hypothetical protein